MILSYMDHQDRVLICSWFSFFFLSTLRSLQLDIAGLLIFGYLGVFLCEIFCHLLLQIVSSLGMK